MLKNKIMKRDPLRILEPKIADMLKIGAITAIIARAGVGKTAFLVQVAISTLLKGQNVLHISIADPVEKVNLWYQEVFQNLTHDYEAVERKQLWEEMLKHRFIMTFETENFNFAKVQKRIEELQSQNIFCPHIVIIDGLLFETTKAEDIEKFKQSMAPCKTTLWLSIRMHRQDELDSSKLLDRLSDEMKMLFDVIFQFTPEKDRIRIKIIDKLINKDTPTAIFLDPSTMLVKEITPL